MIPGRDTGHFQGADATLKTRTCCIPPCANLKKSVETVSAERIWGCIAACAGGVEETGPFALVAPLVLGADGGRPTVVGHREATEAVWLPLSTWRDPARHPLRAVPRSLVTGCSSN